VSVTGSKIGDGNLLARSAAQRPNVLKRPGFTLTVVDDPGFGHRSERYNFTWIKAVLLAPLLALSDRTSWSRSWGARVTTRRSRIHLDYLDFRDLNTALSGLTSHQIAAMI